MADSQSVLSEPDKFGLLIRLREKLDKLQGNELRSFAKSVCLSLSEDALKSVLFAGLNTIKYDLRYAYIARINTKIDKIIKEINKKSKDEAKKTESKTMTSFRPQVPENASLSAVIPSDIISNKICTFLMMKSIMNLAQTDRKMAMICHTPSSISNLMHRHDPYPCHSDSASKLIDGFYQWESLQDYRMVNIETLAIALCILDDCAHLNCYKKVKNLSFYTSNRGYPEIVFTSDAYKGIVPMASLETLSFTSCDELPNVLAFLEAYKNVDDGSSKYYNDIIHQLTHCIH